MIPVWKTMHINISSYLLAVGILAVALLSDDLDLGVGAVVVDSIRDDDEAVRVGRAAGRLGHDDRVVALAVVEGEEAVA